MGHGHELAVTDLAPLGVLFGELDLGLRALELKLRYALDRRSREQRLVAHEHQALALRRARLFRQVRRWRLAAGAQLRALADLAERKTVVDAIRELGENRRREGR